MNFRGLLPYNPACIFKCCNQQSRIVKWIKSINKYSFFSKKSCQYHGFRAETGLIWKVCSRIFKVSSFGKNNFTELSVKFCEFKILLFLKIIPFYKKNMLLWPVPNLKSRKNGNIGVCIYFADCTIDSTTSLEVQRQ